jgi:epoxyqueuosine reductase QueG
MGALLTEELKSLAKSEGADLVGIAPARKFKNISKGCAPKDILPSAKFTVTLGIRLLDDIVKTAPGQEYTAHTRFVNSELNRIIQRLAQFLEKKGYAAVPTPPSTSGKKFARYLSHRRAAVLAGLGVLGRNNLLITPQHGPRVRLVTLVTNAPLKSDPPLKFYPCKNCDICVRACPAGALKNEKTDRRKCTAYLNKIRKKSGQDLRYCGLCIKACPVGKPR